MIASTLRMRTARCWPRDHWAVSVEVVVGRGGAVAVARAGGVWTNGAGVAGVGESWAGWTGTPPGAGGADAAAMGAGATGTVPRAGEP